MRKKRFRYCPYCAAPMQMILKETRKGQEIWKNACPQNDCAFVDWNNPVPVSIVIIPHEDGIVLIERKRNPGKGKIALAGGFVDEDEDPEEAAVREAMEEVGLTIEISRLLMTYTSKSVNQHINVFVAKPVSAIPVAGDDAERAFVCPVADIPFDQLAFNVHRVALKKWLEQTNSP